MRPVLLLDADTYRIVLGALLQSHDPSSASIADELLRSIEERHKSGNLNWKPDSILFNSAIACWGRSQQTHAYRTARSILDRQINLYMNGCESCKPDPYGFTSVLSACASENGDAKERYKAFNVAISTYKQLVNQPEEFGEATHVTYGNMLKACARLLYPASPKKLKWTKEIFQECKDNGLVGGMVLSWVGEATTPQEYKVLMEGHTKENMPRSWSRNVVEKIKYERGGSMNRKRAEV